MKPGDEALVAALLHRLSLPDTLLSLLSAHARAVSAHSARLGLVSEADLPSLLRRHTADSLLFALVRAPKAGEAWADVGSGAGFPGLVLACCYPATKFALVEPARRRAAFLELVSEGLGLANVEVVMKRAEQVPERFDVCVTRALAEPERALAILTGMLRPGGQAIVAVSASAGAPAGVREVRLEASGADLPGRFLASEPLLKGN